MQLALLNEKFELPVQGESLLPVDNLLAKRGWPKGKPRKVA